MVHVSRRITHFQDIFFFRHSEVWSSRNEALMSLVLRRVADTWHHWIITCDANMEPNEFAMGDWVGELKDKQSAGARKCPFLCYGCRGEWTVGQPLTTLCGQRSENTEWSELKRSMSTSPLRVKLWRAL